MSSNSSPDKFAEHFKLSESQTHKLHGLVKQKHAPWYEELFLGLGAWFSATFLAFAMYFFIFSFMDLNSYYMVGMLGLGAIFMSLYIHITHTQIFAKHLSIAICIGGVLTTLYGFSYALAHDSLELAMIFSCIITTGLIFYFKDLIVQFLTCSISIVLIIMNLYNWEFKYVQELICLTTLPIGLYIQYKPNRKIDLTALSYALFLTTPLFYIFPSPPEVSNISISIPNIIQLAILLFLLTTMWSKYSAKNLLGFGILAVVISILLPPGSTATLALMLFAFIMGNRTLAIISVLLEVYFLVCFYYDLNTTLLYKSAILGIVGLSLLAIWRFADFHKMEAGK